ncbi:FGGY-family carbohydrate kinase [Cyanobium sp. NS01]|uniref:FGGY-family carbohydrate kinase n=1 Tax=Cyanobium sp. NS01 TaxID=261284 RepID=UPI001648451C|nr:FGGY-family carbohydrate kinase [Cyanobium sp. NS01]QNI71595.1 carbohydrate kinase/ FGGY family [Cyanobium sp. NS01]
MAGVPSPCALGLDLGSSGLRLAACNASGDLLAEQAAAYPVAFSDPTSWREGLVDLCARLSPELRASVGAIAIDGTSGTLLLCHRDGSLLEGALGQALSYATACPEQVRRARQLSEGDDRADASSDGAAASPAASASGSLARALRLLEAAPAPGAELLLRHQADWLMGWLLADWRWGEATNNLRLGWDPLHWRWQGTIAFQPWSPALPRICASGSVLGRLAAATAHSLGLPASCQVVAGSTDANAAVLAAAPGPGDGVAVLGTTLVLKQFCSQPLQGPGLSCHRVAGRWLVGGASNSGAGVLGQFFSPAQLAELSRQIDPSRPTGLELRPLPGRGERFPVDDPDLEPILGPRPVSDVHFLQALLEGLAAIEQAGWQRLSSLGAPPLQRVISLGGGARNPQWRRLRQQRLGVPVLNRPGLSAALGMARLAASTLKPTPELR